mmetsp:Transcript_4329/g.12091  ORF Transcript_4329/g.12091 Transcript_4329/m.12091 type:complete len:393 (-) Transcript_4329:371-1549(-)
MSALPHPVRKRRRSILAPRPVMRVRPHVPLRQRRRLHPLSSGAIAHGAASGHDPGHRPPRAVEIDQRFHAVEESSAFGEDRLAAAFPVEGSKGGQHGSIAGETRGVQLRVSPRQPDGVRGGGNGRVVQGREEEDGRSHVGQERCIRRIYETEGVVPRYGNGAPGQRISARRGDTLRTKAYGSERVDPFQYARLLEQIGARLEASFDRIFVPLQLTRLVQSEVSFGKLHVVGLTQRGPQRQIVRKGVSHQPPVIIAPAIIRNDSGHRKIVPIITESDRDRRGRLGHGPNVHDQRDGDAEFCGQVGRRRISVVQSHGTLDQYYVRAASASASAVAFRRRGAIQLIAAPFLPAHPHIELYDAGGRSPRRRAFEYLRIEIIGTLLEDPHGLPPSSQ